MLTSSCAPGAAAAKYWKVPLEARIRPDTRPPTDCSHSSRARSGSIVMLDSPSSSITSAPPGAAGLPKMAGSRLWSPTSATITRRPEAAAASPIAVAIVVLPTPPLPVMKMSSRSSSVCILAAVCLNPPATGGTYNRLR